MKRRNIDKLKEADKKLKERRAGLTLRPELLIGPNSPKPLHGVVPREILGAAWWRKTRKAAFESTHYHCLACGTHKTAAKSRQWMEGHELYQIDYLMGRSVYVETVPLCHYCHNYIHDGRLQSLLDRGQIQHAKFAAIIRHGDEILRRHKLTRTRYKGPFADWEDWRLVIDGVEYPPKYKTYDEWLRFHGE